MPLVMLLLYFWCRALRRYVCLHKRWVMPRLRRGIRIYEGRGSRARGWQDVPIGPRKPHNRQQ